MVNGQESAQGIYINNERNGEWKFTRGSLMIVGTYANGLKEGTWLYIQRPDTLAVLNYKEDELNGEQVGYYDNGQLASRIHYSTDERDGKSEYYFENGKLQEIRNFKNGEYEGENLIYARDGSLVDRLMFYHNTPVDLKKESDQSTSLFYSGDLKDGTGTLETYNKDSEGKNHLIIKRQFKDSLLQGEVIKYNMKDKFSFKGQYEHGIMVGEWNFYDYSGNRDHKKTYQVSDSIKEDPEEASTKNYNEQFFIVQKMPEFPEGDVKLRIVIAKNVVFPANSRDMGIQGKVYVQFVVNTTGEIEQVKAVKKVHPELDEEAVRVVRELPPWTLGFLYGIPVKVSFTVPIGFRLD